MVQIKKITINIANLNINLVDGPVLKILKNLILYVRLKFSTGDAKETILNVMIPCKI